MIRRHHIPFWLVMLLLLCGHCRPAHATGCQSHECSNDVRGIIGDETLSWDAVDIATSYEIKRDDQGAACLTVGWEQTTVNISHYCLGEPRPPGNGDIVLRVRACNSSGVCSINWSEGVEFRVFSCPKPAPNKCNTKKYGLVDCDPGCEAPCWYGAPLRLSVKYPPCP